MHLYFLYRNCISEALFLGQHTLAKLCEWQISLFCLLDNVAPSWFCTNEERKRSNTVYFVLACCIKQACFLPHTCKGHLKQSRRENLVNIPLPSPSMKDFSLPWKPGFLANEKKELRGADSKAVNLLGGFCHSNNCWTVKSPSVALWHIHYYADFTFSDYFCVYEAQQLSCERHNYNWKPRKENKLGAYNQSLREGANIWEKWWNESCLKSFKAQLSKQLGRRD